MEKCIVLGEEIKGKMSKKMWQTMSIKLKILGTVFGY